MTSACRTALCPPLRPCRRAFLPLVPNLQSRRSLAVPRIVQPSFWVSMIPQPLRVRLGRPKTREWNPATPYIVLGLLVGSQAIQILWLKQERGHSLSRAEAKIGVLREVIERVQRGEEVRVDEMLGTGSTASETEWAEVLRDMGNEDMLFQGKKERKASRQQAAAAAQRKSNGPPTTTDEDDGISSEQAATLVKVETVAGVRFY